MITYQKILHQYKIFKNKIYLTVHLQYFPLNFHNLNLILTLKIFKNHRFKINKMMLVY